VRQVASRGAEEGGAGEAGGDGSDVAAKENLSTLNDPQGDGAGGANAAEPAEGGTVTAAEQAVPGRKMRSRFQQSGMPEMLKRFLDERSP
jgi:hypothetical protein